MEATMKEEFDKLRANLVKVYRKIGDKKGLVMPLARAKNVYTGNELANEIEQKTEFGNEHLYSLLHLTVDLLSREKFSIKKDLSKQPQEEQSGDSEWDEIFRGAFEVELITGEHVTEYLRRLYKPPKLKEK